MALAELLAKLSEIAERHNLNRPYICGGVVRDLAFAREGNGEFKIETVNDIDITTGHSDVGLLADLFAGAVGQNAKTFPDGHKQVHADGIDFDFSTNFHYSNIDELLKNIGIDAPTDLQRETFSRDFTINALLMPMDFSEIIDLTGKGLPDIKSRILRCPLNADVSFKANHNRLIRAWLYRARFGMSFDKELEESMKNNLGLFREISPRYAGEKLNEAVRLRPELLDELIESGVLGKLQLTKHLSRMLIKKRRINDVLPPREGHMVPLSKKAALQIPENIHDDWLHGVNAWSVVVDMLGKDGRVQGKVSVRDFDNPSSALEYAQLRAGPGYYVAITANWANIIGFADFGQQLVDFMRKYWVKGLGGNVQATPYGHELWLEWISKNGEQFELQDVNAKVFWGIGRYNPNTHESTLEPGRSKTEDPSKALPFGLKEYFEQYHSGAPKIGSQQINMRKAAFIANRIKRLETRAKREPSDHPYTRKPVFMRNYDYGTGFSRMMDEFRSGKIKGARDFIEQKRREPSPIKDLYDRSKKKKRKKRASVHGEKPHTIVFIVEPKNNNQSGFRMKEFGDPFLALEWAKTQIGPGVEIAVSPRVYEFDEDKIIDREWRSSDGEDLVEYRLEGIDGRTYYGQEYIGLVPVLPYLGELVLKKQSSIIPPLSKISTDAHSTWPGGYCAEYKDYWKEMPDGDTEASKEAKEDFVEYVGEMQCEPKKKKSAVALFKQADIEQTLIDRTGDLLPEISCLVYKNHRYVDSAVFHSIKPAVDWARQHRQYGNKVIITLRLTDASDTIITPVELDKHVQEYPDRFEIITPTKVNNLNIPSTVQRAIHKAGQAILETQKTSVMVFEAVDGGHFRETESQHQKRQVLYWIMGDRVFNIGLGTEIA